MACKDLLIKEPCGDAYQSLIRFARGLSTEFGLVVRPELPLEPTGERVLSELRPFLLREETVAEWPGTKLMDGTATYRTYRCEAGSINLLGICAKSLFSWQQPELPEDLCFYRSPLRPWMISISHEHDVILRLDDNEMARFTGDCPLVEIIGQE